VPRTCFCRFGASAGNAATQSFAGREQAREDMMRLLCCQRNVSGQECSALIANFVAGENQTMLEEMRSATAAMVRNGFTPTAIGMTDPSIT